MAPPWTGSSLPAGRRAGARFTIIATSRRSATAADRLVVYPSAPMAKRRRTSGIQRQRASAEALNRRIDQRGGGAALPDWRLLLIGGVLVVGVLLLVLVFVFGGGPAASIGV